MEWLKNLSLVVVSFFISYLAVELLVSSLYQKGYIEPQVLWIIEETDPAGQIRFDPRSGVRLSDKEGRIALWHTRNGLFSVASFKGNNYGFSDRDDFTPRKSNEDTFRIIVFGDSFSANFFIENSWSQIIEDNLRREGLPIEIYNFSIDGSGLANWWQILEKIIITESFEVDAILISATHDNFIRPHYWADASRCKHSGPTAPAVHVHYTHTFDPDEIISPQEFEGSHLVNFPIYKPEKFKRLLDNKHTPYFRRPFTFYLTEKLLPQAFAGFNLAFLMNNQWRITALEAFSKYKVENHIPIYLFAHDSLENLVDHDKKLLQVDHFINMNDPFNKIIDHQHYLVPDDGHWAQAGHDIVAKYLEPFVERWYAKWKVEQAPH